MTDQRRKRPRDPAQLAKFVIDIATGKIEDRGPPKTPAQEFARSGGLKGGKARAEVLSPSRRSQIAKKAAKARWIKNHERAKTE